MINHEFGEQGRPYGLYCGRCEAEMVVANVWERLTDLDIREATALICKPNRRYGVTGSIVVPEYQGDTTRCLDLSCPAIWDMARTRLSYARVAVLADTVDLNDRTYQRGIFYARKGDPIGWWTESEGWRFGLYGGGVNPEERPVVLLGEERRFTLNSLVLEAGQKWFNFRTLFKPQTRGRE